MRVHNPPLGIALILVTYFLFSMVDTMTKLMAEALPPVQTIWLRYLVQSSLMFLIFAPQHGRSMVVTKHFKMNVIRGSVAVGSSMFFIYAAIYLPLPVITTVLFTNPLMVCLLSALFLGERIGWRRIGAIIIGFAGVAIVLRPVGIEANIGVLSAIATALCLSIFSVMSRALAGKSKAYTQQTYASLVPLILLGPFAYLAWQVDMTTEIMLTIGAMGICSGVGYYLLAVAHQYAPATTLAPFVYSMIVWISLTSWLVFDEPPDGWVILGTIVVVGSGLYVWIRERQLAKHSDQTE